MGTISKILNSKSDAVFSISPDITVYQALEVMVKKNVSALAILENGKLVGIFSEKDYARKVVLLGRVSRETFISEIMTKDVITVSPEGTIEDCMRLMTSKTIRHLPVVSNGTFMGILSIVDVLNYLLEEKKFIIESMQNYIKGT